MSKPEIQHPWRAAILQLENGRFQAARQNIETGEVVTYGGPGAREDVSKAMSTPLVGPRIDIDLDR
jgi:hypothetical protein